MGRAALNLIVHSKTPAPRDAAPSYIGVYRSVPKSSVPLAAICQLACTRT
ncbi:hypothetical protein EV131_104283 [Rhizobium laguerreae]|uniref:Uncharacterized protein n=1 Tax=Rhizobium laguerreae TaxID=1076926 RepID=A0AAX2QPU3_9HYPH|nr:hypothetical protein EV131_104283 [Rhizobium laguerreae]